jgi:hypothetical protein
MMEPAGIEPATLVLAKSPQQVLTRCRALPLRRFRCDSVPAKCSRVVTVRRNYLLPTCSRAEYRGVQWSEVRITTTQDTSLTGENNGDHRPFRRCS